MSDNLTLDTHHTRVWNRAIFCVDFQAIWLVSILYSVFYMCHPGIIDHNHWVTN